MVARLRTSRLPSSFVFWWWPVRVIDVEPAFVRLYWSTKILSELSLATQVFTNHLD